MDSEQKKKYIGLLLERNILVEPSKLNIYTEDDFRALLGLKSEVEAANTEQAHNAAAAPALEMHESEKENPKIIEKPKPAKPDGKVKIVFNYQDEYKKREVQDFVSYFNKRFESLRNMLRERRELNNITSINKLLAKKDKAEMSLIGIILNIQKTKNGHIMLTLEDKTGSINVLVNKNRQDLMEIAQELVLDEVIGISGTVADKIIFSNKIVLPDVIMNKEFKKSPDEAYAVFISDLHVGAKKFMAENVDKFIDWLKGNVGNDVQKNMASKVKYLFIAGDLVEGVGIFPEQESELEVKDIYDQFKLCAEYLKKIPSHIHIILCPGNHDPVRLAEPQPVIPREYAKPLYDMKNVTIVSSPGIVNIHSSQKFSGFDVMLYHGNSLIYYADKVEAIREKGGIDSIDLVMKFLLQKRHLAPTHTSWLYIPDTRSDPMVIDTIPDFFVTGHIHKVAVSNFRSTTLVCGSCWIGATSYQEKLGVHPEPARVPVVNLQTREMKILRF